jgi:hypothetical protein
MEYRMTWDDFNGVTLPELESLEDRRNISIRHNRFNAALVATVLINANRAGDNEPVSPFDFIADFQRSPDEIEAEKLRKSIKSAIALAFVQMKGASREEVLAEKAAMIQRMTNNGVEDPEGLIREVYPDL